METAVILVECADQKGIVAGISSFLYECDANIIQADQHSTDPQNGRFFLRVEFCFNTQDISTKNIEEGFKNISKRLKAQYHIRYKSKKLNMGILVSKQDHCLFDILYRYKSGELNVNIPFVASNHETLKGLVESYGIPFYFVPVNKENKIESEKKILELICKKTDFLLLARYMQILTPKFLSVYKKPIINIHHSFLPSFKGANPYKQAYERGVKVIGATSHYVTENLDEGPIISQVVRSVSHRDGIEKLKRIGKDLEKQALVSAVHAHIEHRIIKFDNKTVVFD